jgi:hypothetical protein
MAILLIIIYVLSHITPPLALAVSIWAFTASTWAVHPILFILILFLLA